MQWIAGVDEAGRGPLAGPVVAAAVIIKEVKIPDFLTDSKKLSEKKRTLLFEQIKQDAECYAISIASREEIDELNIHHATLLAMQRAIEGLGLTPAKCLIDGKFTPTVSMPCEAIVKGDLLIPSISAASVLAKVARDQMMVQAHEQYPDYGFAKHKGYGTAQHLSALAQYGPCEYHRRSFRPISELISNS